VPWAGTAALRLVAVERCHVGEGPPVQLLVPGVRLRLFGAPVAGFVVVAAFLVAFLVAGNPAAATPGAGASPTQSVQEELSKFGALAPVDISDVESPSDLAPDVSLLVDRAGSPIDENTSEAEDQEVVDDGLWWVAVRSALLDRAEVGSVAVDFPDAGATVFHIGLNETEIRSRSLAEATEALAELVVNESSDGPDVTVTAGGRALGDASITGRFGTTVGWLALLALLFAGYVGWRLGPERGVAMAVAWGGSVLLAGRIVHRVVGPFDGTIATGPLIGAAAGLLFALVVGLRLVKWYENPDSTDGADAIRRSLAEVGSDVVLVLGGLVAVVGVLWIAGGSSRSVVAVVIGGLVGAAFTAAIAAFALAALGPEDGRPVNLLPAFVPSGGQLMVVTVLGLVGLLVVLSAFAFRSSGRDLIDYRALPDDDPARIVGDRLGTGPGDPTEALVTVVEASSSDATDTWAQAVATLSNVAWVDTANARFTGAGSRTVDPTQSLASEEQVGFDSVELAIIVPAVPIRSAEGAQLVDEVVRLADERVDVHGAAGPLGRGSTTLIVAAIVLVALAGAGTILVETDNAGYTLTSFVLRVLGGAATVGLYRLVSADASAAETIAALTLLAAAVSLFELEYLHDRVRFGDRWSASAGLVTVTRSGRFEPASGNGSNGDTSGDSVTLADPASVETPQVDEPALGSDPGGETLDVPGRAALLAIVALPVAALWISLTRFVGGGPTVGRFGFGLAVALVVEIAVGVLVLRPALLGEQAAYHSVARPLRSTLHTGQRRQRNQPISVDDPAWRRLVSDLLMAEFGLQTDPAATRVDDVFLEGTPLFGQASEQHRSLSASGLRVSGRAPQIKRVETYREGPSIMVSVTVDHPERHLIDQEGTVYGVRRAQRRSTMLWLVGHDSGAVRIAESIDMGSVPLDVDEPPDSTTFPEVATVSG